MELTENKLKQRVQRNILTVSVLILVGKFIAYYLTNSVGVLTDAMESFLNPLDNMQLTCSIGIAKIHNEKNFDEIYQKADEMLYYVKSSGRNGYAFSSDD